MYSPYLKKFWQSLFSFNGVFGLTLILIWGIFRFIIVLHANKTGNYQWVSVIFISMWVTPFLFLNQAGRKQIGIKKPRKYAWLLYSFVLGMLCCALMFLVATALYGDTISNWFVYISRSYPIASDSFPMGEKWSIFWVYALIGMTFSPIGEELFYRGLVHESFALQWDERKASLVDSTAFAVTHLAHFGIVYVSGTWEVLVGPGLLWTGLLFGTCIVFFICRQKTDSILGAILSHAGYNFAMTYFIFFHVL